MIQFYLNNELIVYQGNENLSLLNFLRNERQLTAAKDGCSSQRVRLKLMIKQNLLV